MFDWIQANSTVLNTLATCGTLFLWLFYAQLLYNGYRRQRRPRVLINQGVGARDLDARCLIGNMSQEPVFIQFVLARLNTNQGSAMSPASDSGEGAVDEEGSFKVRQGPLNTSESVELQSFRELIDKTTDAGNIELRDGLPADPNTYFKNLEIFVIYIYGPEDQPVGATRTFEFQYDDRGNVSLHPASIDTNRMTSLGHRRQLKTWLHEYL